MALPTASIPLVMSADDGYAMQLAVAVRSILDSLSDGEAVSLYVLDGGVSPKSRERCVESWDGRCASIDWIQPSAEFRAALPKSTLFPPATFYRIAVAELLPASMDRVIFADPDVIFLRSPLELLGIDMLGLPLAAVQDAGCPYIDSRVAMANFRLARRFVHGEPAIPGLPRRSPIRHNPYFNAGLMVLDLAMFRRERIGEQLLRFCRDHSEDLLWADQCALNAVLAGRWLKLDSAWNVVPSVFRFPDHRSSPFDADTLNRIRLNPWMLHFAGRSKPWWHGCNHPFVDAYWRVLDRTAWRGWRPDPVLDRLPLPVQTRRTGVARAADVVVTYAPAAARPLGGLFVAVNQSRLRRVIDRATRRRMPADAGSGEAPVTRLVPRPPPGCAGGIDHYHHFVFDLLLPLWALRGRIDSRTRIAVPPAGPLTPKITELFGDQVVIDPGTIDPGTPRMPLVGMNPLGVTIMPGILAQFRQFARDRFGVTGIPRPDLVVLVERISPAPYFTRAPGTGGSGALRRSILNHTEIQRAIERAVRPGLRFRNVQLETMTLAEQVEVLSRTALLIGQHGGGLANALWMQPGHAVAELCHGSPRHYARLSRLCRHRHVQHEIGADHAVIDASALMARLIAEPALRRFLGG